MRYFYIFFLFISLIACKAKSTLKPTIIKNTYNATCPEGGTCSFNINKNKILQINTDYLEKDYPKMVNGNHSVLKFEYKKHRKSEYKDSDYREELFIELDLNDLEIETEALKDKKIFFARWCYCKGETGYYKIINGKLSITKVGHNTFHLYLSFKIKDIPQIINEISYTFNLQ